MVKWQVPDVDTIKVNFEPALDLDGGRIGIGVIARNNSGDIVLVKAGLAYARGDAERAEAMAALEAVQVARAHGVWQRIVFEGDAQTIVRALEGELQRRGDIQLYIDDVISLCSSFNWCKFNFCYRNCNEAAHRIAKWALASDCERVWVDEGPSWLQNVVISDLSN